MRYRHHIYLLMHDIFATHFEMTVVVFVLTKICGCQEASKPTEALWIDAGISIPRAASCTRSKGKMCVSMNSARKWINAEKQVTSEKLLEVSRDPYPTVRLPSVETGWKGLIARRKYE